MAKAKRDAEIEDYERRIVRNIEKPQFDDFAEYGLPGKFEGEPRIILRLYEMSQGGGEAELGEVDCFGYYSLLLNVRTLEGEKHFIVSEDNAGFFSIAEEYNDEKEARDAWETLEEEYEESGCAGGEY